MYEDRKSPILKKSHFIARLANHFAVALLFVVASLFIGILGYHELESLSWTDSFLNAAMILGGMGPVNILQTEAGKLFAGFYALYSGMLFLVTAAILFTPLLHRIMHRLHADDV